MVRTQPASELAAEAGYTFRLDEGLGLPTELTFHTVGPLHLCIAPAKGAWITTNKIGSGLIEGLRRGQTIGTVLSDVADALLITQAEALFQLRLLLLQVVAKRFFEDAAVLKDDITDFNLQLHLTQRCNLKCTHCYMDSGLPSATELAAEEWISIINDFADLGGTSVTFTGGEPLLHESLFDVCHQANARGLTTLLLSNGTLIQNSNIASLVSALFDQTRISIDGATPMVHDKIRGQGTFSKTMTAIHLLSASRANLALAITVAPENIADISANIRDFLLNLDNDGIHLRSVGISKAMREGRCTQSVDDVTFELAYRGIVRSVCGLPAEVRRYQPLGRTHCAYGAGIAVSADGRAFPCGSLIGDGEEVRKRALRDIRRGFLESRSKSHIEDMPLCSCCDLRHICAGGCRLQNLLQTGDMRQPVCSAERRNFEYQRLTARDQVFVEAMH